MEKAGNEKMKKKEQKNLEREQQPARVKVTFLEEGVSSTPSEWERKKQRRRIRRLAVVGALVLVVLSALCVTAAAGWLSAERISLSVYDANRGKTVEENLPLSMNGLKVSRVDEIGYCFGVLDHLKYSVYTPACNLRYTYTHHMSSPVTVTSDRRVLLYERGNYTVTVLSTKELLWSKTMEKEIISADMNNKNRVILATGSDRYLSQVTLLDRNGQELQTWFSAERYAVDVAISPDGDEFAVALVWVVNGEEQSVVSLFRVGETEPRKEYEFSGDTVHDLRYLADGTLMAVGTSCCTFYNDQMEMTGRYNYQGQSLSFFTDSGQRAVLYFAPGAGEEKGTLVMLNHLAEPVGTVQVDTCDFLTADREGTVYLCRQDTVLTVQWEGEACRTGTISVREEMGDVIRLLPTEDKTLILSIGGLYSSEERVDTEAP